MSYNIFELIAGVLGEPSENSIQSEEITKLSDHFTLTDFVITITLKGIPRYRLLPGKIDKQFEILKMVINNIISNYSSQHLFTFELHKCGEWLHTHGIIQMNHRSKMMKMRKEIYEYLENKPLKKGLTYKHRVHVEKVYNVDNWQNYIYKDIEIFDTLKKEFKNLHLIKKLKYNTL